VALGLEVGEEPLPELRGGLHATDSTRR
jgi:hypothetical protein